MSVRAVSVYATFYDNNLSIAHTFSFIVWVKKAIHALQLMCAERSGYYWLIYLLY